MTEKQFQEIERDYAYGYGQQYIPDLIAEVRRLQFALEDIARRHEEADSGQGFVGGNVAWAMWRTACKALGWENG